MKDKKDKEPEDFIESFVREKAHKAAQQLIQEISEKAAKDVEARMRQFEPQADTQKIAVPATVRCGRVDDDASEFRLGMEQLFQKYYRLGMAALNKGDPTAAIFYLGRCLVLPVSEELKLRQMVRNNLRLAMSLKARMTPPART